MAVRARALSTLAIVIDGYRAAQAPQVLTRARAAARDVQDQIADDFESEQAAGSALFRNKRTYTVSKIIAGYDPRRGHRTGNLQRALWRQGLVKVDQQSNRTLLLLLPGVLQGRVPYAEHYEAAKVRGGSILRVYPELVAIVQDAVSGIRVPREEPSIGPRVRALPPRRGVFEVVADVLGAVFGRAV